MCFPISSASLISNHYSRSHNGNFLAPTPHDLNDLNDTNDNDNDNEDEDEDMDQENNDDFEDGEVDDGEVDDLAPGSFMNQSGLLFPRDMNITDAYNYSGDEFNFPDNIYEDESQQPLAGPSRGEALGDQMIGM
jgi:hypothetical protein